MLMTLHSLVRPRVDCSHQKDTTIPTESDSRKTKRESDTHCHSQPCVTYKCDASWEKVPTGEKIKNCCFSDSARKKVQLEWDQSQVGRFKHCAFKVGKTEKWTFEKNAFKVFVLILLGKCVREHWWMMRMQHSDIKLNRESNGDSSRSVGVQGGMLYHPRPLPYTHPYSYYLQIIQIAKISTLKFTLQWEPLTN